MNLKTNLEKLEYVFFLSGMFLFVSTITFNSIKEGKIGQTIIIILLILLHFAITILTILLERKRNSNSNKI